MSMLKGLPIERSNPPDADVDAARGEAARVVGGVDERTREKAYQAWLIPDYVLVLYLC